MYELHRQQNILHIADTLKQLKKDIKKSCDEFNERLEAIDKNVSVVLQLALLERSKGQSVGKVLDKLDKLSKVAPKPFNGY